MKELDTKTVQAGNARLMTDEDYQQLHSYYFKKYPNRRPAGLIRPNNALNDSNRSRHIFEIFADSAWVQDLRSDRDHYKELLKIALEQNSQLQKLLLEKK